MFKDVIPGALSTSMAGPEAPKIGEPGFAVVEVRRHRFAGRDRPSHRPRRDV
jgi:hypothetical protein